MAPLSFYYDQLISSTSPTTTSLAPPSSWNHRTLHHPHPISQSAMTCKSCISRFFGILGSNIFFIALVAFAVAVSTNQWTVSHQRGVDVKGVLTDADMEFGIFDMLASVRQGEEVIWSQYSYNWCDSLDVRDPNVRRRRGERGKGGLLRGH